MSSLPASTFRRADASRPVDERRPENRLLARQRLLQPDRRPVAGPPASRLHVYASEKPKPTSVVLDPPADPLVLGEPAEHRLARRQRGRHVVEAEARDLLDDVDLAGDVARAPRRHATRSRPSTSKPSRRRIACCSSAGVSIPTTASARSGRKRTTGGCGQLGMDVGVADPARTRKLDEQLVASVAACSREIRIDALLPAVRALRAQAQALGGAEDRVRLEVRGLEQDLRRVARAISVSSPPMIPASATARSPSAISRSSGSSSRSTPSSVRSRSPVLRAPHDDLARRRASRSRRRAADCRARA